MILLFSCSGNYDSGSVLTTRVERRDYVDKITISGTLESVKTVSISAPMVRSTLSINFLIPEGSYVKSGDTVCIISAENLEEEYSKSVDQYYIARAEYNKSKADLNLQYLMLESQVNTIDISTTITKLDSLKLKFTSPLENRIIELELEKAEIERQMIISKLKFLKSINRSEMKKMELRIKQEQNKIEGALDQLNKLMLTASVDGLVVYATSWMTGDKVMEGDRVFGNMPILEIPQMDQLQVKLFVNETYFKQIEEGQHIEVSVDAIPDMKLPGKIKRKARMGKPIKRGSKVKAFEIIASLDSSFLSVQPGLSVTCDVHISKISDTLVIPTVSVFEEDSFKVVYIEEGKRFNKQRVEIARGNNQFSVIKSGLSGNEIIASSKPSESLIVN